MKSCLPWKRGILNVVLGVATLANALADGAGRLTITWLEMPVHGLAVVIETPSGHVHLIDTGGTRQGGADNYNAGRDTIGPFLAAQGRKEIAGIVVSHPHGDHYGGAGWLLENWRVHEFVDNGYEGRGQSDAYKQLRTVTATRGAVYLLEKKQAEDQTALRATAQARAGAYRAVTEGAVLDWDPALTVEVLSPPAAFLSMDADPKKVSEHGLLNSNSILLRVQHGKNVFLFPGDSYGGAFEQHLKTTIAPERVRATVLTAPHHGFNPGTNFPKMVQAGIVVVSCVADYPSNATTPYPRSPGTHATKIFSALGAKVYVTAWHGHVQVTSDGETVKTTVQRDSAPWPEPPKLIPSTK